MTRKEEIIQAARQREKEVGFTQIVKDAKGVNSAYGIGFLEGAVWADEHHVNAFKLKWSDQDEENLQHCCGAIWAADYYTYDDKQEMEEWLKSLKERLKNE